MMCLGVARRRVAVCRTALVWALTTFVTAFAVLGAQQQPSPQAQAAQAQLQKRFAYPVVRDQRGAVPPGPRPLPAPPLADGPWVWPTMEQRDIKVSIVTRGLSHPWSLAFLPDGVVLITEKIGRLRIVRNGVLDPNPVAGVPPVLSRATMAGLMDIALHPDFAQNKWLYISYHKPVV
jgi:glucose/arabinose dehydrogenase